MRITYIFIILLLIGVGNIRGQLSDMSISSIEIVGTDKNGPTNSYNKKPFALFVIDIENNDKNNINGEEITALMTNRVRPANDNDQKYDAYAEAWEESRAKKMTLHHSDFNNCTIEFSDFLGDKHLEGGTIYKIKVKIPSLQLIEATKYYNDMDFNKASILFTKMLDDKKANVEEKIIVSNHMDDIDSLISYQEKAIRYERSAIIKNGKDKDRDLYRARIYFNKIFKESGVIKAAMKVEEINKALGIKSQDINLPSLNNIKIVDAKIASNDTRARGNDAIKYDIYDKKGRAVSKKCALLVIDIPLNGMEVESPRCVKGPFIEYGKHLIYIKTECGEDEDPVLFTINHPDYQTFEFHLSDLVTDKGLEEETAYSIDLDTPSLIMAMANKQLSSLDFNGALNFFRYNFEDAEEQVYADKCKEFLQSSLILPLMRTLDEDVRKCGAVEKEYIMISTGTTKFTSPEERNTRLKQINQDLEKHASQLASTYESIYNEAKRKGIYLQKAYNLAEEYSNIKNGLRRLPLIIEFREIQELQSGVYKPDAPMSLSPTVKIEFFDSNKKKVDEAIKTVKDGKISFMANTRSSYLFKEGKGKIKISTPKDINYNSRNNKYQPYKDADISISSLKTADFTTKKLNIKLIKNK